MAYPTNPKYKLIKDPLTGLIEGVKTQTGNSEPYFVSVIPINEENTDYQNYLAWVAEGNTAEAAD